MVIKTLVFLFSIISIAEFAPTNDDDSSTTNNGTTFENPNIEEPLPSPVPKPEVNQTIANTCADVVERLKTDKKTVRDCLVGFDGHIYFRIENRLPWEDARDACRLIKDSDLISVHNFEEKMLLNSLALNNYFNDYFEYDQRQGSWIGLHRKDMSCDNEMEWSDNTPVDYEDFIQDEPNCAARRQEFCVYAYRRVIKHSGVVAGWNDGECDELLKSICKMTRPKEGSKSKVDH